MSLNWSLKELYQSFGSNEFKNDMNNLTEEISSINEWIDEATKDYENVIVKLEEYLKKSIKLNELISKLGVFIELSISVNTKDSEALKNSDIFEKKLTYLVEGSTKIERYISGLKDLNLLIEKSELLKEHKFLFRFAFIREWRRKRFLKKYFAKQKKTGDWPFWVTKTDEERCQNLPALFIDNHKQYWVTEKIDGTSTTFTMAQAPRKKRHAIICSRNVVFNTPEKEKQNYYKDTDGNVYVEMFEKYNINKVLNYILDEHPDYEFITIQGETYGGTIQKRKYCDDHRLAIFNYIYKKKGEAPVRLNPAEMYDKIKTINFNLGVNLETVPIIGQMTLEGYDCDTLLQDAEGYSEIDRLPREGLVFRDLAGKESFKAVSNSFLEKYHS